jgi:hypothetical protein
MTSITKSTLTPITVTAPNLPLPSDQVTALYMKQLTNVLRLFFAQVTNALNQNIISDSQSMGGTVTFAAATTATVTFSTAMPNTNYYIGLGGNAAGYCWYTNKATTGFVIHCSASNSNVTDWVVQS